MSRSKRSGRPQTFELCTELIRPGGRVANVGVHGTSRHAAPGNAVDPRRDDHDRARRHQHDAEAAEADRRAAGSTRPPFATHHFPLDETKGPTTPSPQRPKRALKVVLEAQPLATLPAPEQAALAVA